MGDEEQTGGDPACWLSNVCTECGAFNDEGAETCWRCGAARPDA